MHRPVCIPFRHRILLTITFFCSFALLVCAVEYDEDGNIIIKHGPTVEQATESLKKADIYLNTAYKFLLEAETMVYGKGAKQELIDAQLAWIKYRDLEITSAAKNPFDLNKKTGPIIVKADLTQERALRLKNRLEKLYEALDLEQCISKRHDFRTDRLEKMIWELKKVENGK